MAISKALIASVFLSLLLHHQFVVQAIETNQMASNSAAPSSGGSIGKITIDCGGACKERCLLSKRPNLCKRACGTCCTRCNCVPKGTYGNYDSCACYANMTTHGDKRKCP